MICSLILLVNCKNDDDSDSGNNNANANEQTYLDETYPVDFVTVYYFNDELIMQGGNADESHGFGIMFLGAEMEQIDGHYVLNTDGETYNPQTEFKAGAVYYLDDTTYAQEGEATIEIDEQNQKIKINVELIVQGEILTAHYEGVYN